MDKKIRNLYIFLKKLGLHQDLKKLAGEFLQQDGIRPGILFYEGAWKNKFDKIQFFVDLDGATYESVKSFIDQVKDLNLNPKVREGRIYYKEEYSEKPLEAPLYGDQIRLPWTVFNDVKNFDLTIEFFEKNFPGLFDLDLVIKREKILKQIKWPEIRDPSTRSSEHMTDILMEEIDHLVSEGKGRDFLQDFINGFYAALEDSLAWSDQNKNYYSKSEAWRQGYIFRIKTSQLGDVASEDPIYLAENRGRSSFDTDIDEIKGRGISPDILEGEMLLQSPEADLIITVGEHYLKNNNLNEISFDVLDKAKNKVKEWKNSSTEAFSLWREQDLFPILKKTVERLTEEIKDNLSLLETEKNRLGGKDPSWNSSLFAGRLIIRLINSLSYLIEERARIEYYIRSLNEIINNDEEIIKDLEEVLKGDAPASAKETINKTLSRHYLELEKMKQHLELLKSVVKSTNSLLKDPSNLLKMVKMIP